MPGRSLPRAKNIALAVAVAAAATVGGALFFEHVLGYVPCKLCLTERLPYYTAIPLALLAALLPASGTRVLLGLVAVVLFYGSGLGVYHAGAEWGFWPGPTDCGGGSGPGPAAIDDFLEQLKATRAVDCSTAAWRFLGVSLAGWNAVVALALAVLAASAVVRADQSDIGPHQPGR